MACLDNTRLPRGIGLTSATPPILNITSQTDTELERLLNTYEELPTLRFVDIIQSGGEQADLAMYYLLHQRLNSRLKERFVVFKSRLLDDFDDIVDDFFLYLRDGNGDKPVEPYRSLHRIQKKESFEAWMVSTFRNYLSLRAEKEGQITTTELSDAHIPNAEDTTSDLSDQRKLSFAAQLIAYAHQMFNPRNRFIFLRSLLTMLNKKQALPNEAMAQALGMTEISYRVTIHRLKRRLENYRTLLIQGKALTLDESHRKMAACINDDFDHLYPTLMRYYGQTLETLNNADAIKHLRQEYYDATCQMLHEPQSTYSLTPSISAFWNNLNGFLIV